MTEQTQKPVVVTKKEFEVANEGIHSAIITRVEDKGLVDGAFGKVERVYVYYTVQDQRDKSGALINVIQPLNKSLGAKSNMYKTLKQLGFAPESTFDLATLVGIPCQIVVEHVEKDGRILANIVTVIASKRKSTPTPTNVETI